jgi:hypothetical protein
MGAVSYRDGDAVLRDMLASKREDALSRARSLGHAQRAVVDEAAIAAVEALHDRTMPFLLDEPGSPAEAHAAIRAVDELVAAYDAVLARSAAVLVPAALPVEPLLAPMIGWHATSENMDRVRVELGEALPEARILEVRAHGIAAVVPPWALLVGFYVEDDVQCAQGQITVAIPEAVPPVRARAERNIDDFKQHLGIAKEIETGDARFDDACWLEGPREAAFAVTTPAVRRVLVALSQHHGALEVGGGLARISWAGPSSELGATGVPALVVTAILELHAAFSQ